MKTDITIKGQKITIDGTADELMEFCNLLPDEVGAPKSTPEASEAKAPKKRVNRGKAFPWDENEVMAVVNFVSSIPVDTKGLPDLAVSNLQNHLKRSESGIYNLSSRIQQYLQGNPSGKKYLSKRILKTLQKHGVQPLPKKYDQDGFLGRVNNEGVGRRLEVKEA